MHDTASTSEAWSRITRKSESSHTLECHPSSEASPVILGTAVAVLCEIPRRTWKTCCFTACLTAHIGVTCSIGSTKKKCGCSICCLYLVALPDMPVLCQERIAQWDHLRLQEVSAQHCMRPHRSLRSTIRGDQLALVRGFASEYSNAGLPEA